VVSSDVAVLHVDSVGSGTGSGVELHEGLLLLLSFLFLVVSGVGSLVASRSNPASVSGDLTLVVVAISLAWRQILDEAGSGHHWGSFAGNSNLVGGVSSAVRQVIAGVASDLHERLLLLLILGLGFLDGGVVEVTILGSDPAGVAWDLSLVVVGVGLARGEVTSLNLRER